MATRPIEGSVSALTNFPPMPAMARPMPAMARTLSRFERRQLAGFIAVAKELLDTLDENPDDEEDDPSGQCDEDEINANFELAYAGSPGFEISDPGAANMGAKRVTDSSR